MSLSDCNPYNGNPSIYTMILSFLGNISSCYQYDNWDGRCNITRIMGSVGPFGWMLNFTDSGFYDFISRWQLEMIKDPNNYEAYFYDDGSLY